MRIRKLRPIRTTLDLPDEAQVRSVRKRLSISNDDLIRIVAKIGNSISAITSSSKKAVACLDILPDPTAGACLQLPGLCRRGRP